MRVHFNKRATLCNMHEDIIVAVMNSMNVTLIINVNYSALIHSYYNFNSILKSSWI